SGCVFSVVTMDWELSAWFFVVWRAIRYGLLLIYFACLSKGVDGWFARILNPYRKVWLSGLMLGLLIFLFPALYGEGYLAIQQILDGNQHALLDNSIFSAYSQYGYLVVCYAIITVFAKSAASVITLNSGGNGGIFGPTVVMGGLLGFAFAYGLN